MELTGLQIFKYTPGYDKSEKANCKECGCPTCMMFSLKLAKKIINIEKCPYLDKELENLYFKSIKPAQDTVIIKNKKIGGENVLYRHEKTFVNKTLCAVILDCENADFEEKFNRINGFSIDIINEKNEVDLIILKNSQNAKSFILENPKVITYEELLKFNIDFVQEEDFNTTKEYLINAREKAVLEKDENYSRPVCVFVKNNDIYDQCARASFYLCKYANMLVFEDFNEDMFSTMFALRQNIYTNPQQTLQVDSGLYEFNNPQKNSLVFLTTNFALTFFAVSNELEALEIPSYLIVIPAKGMSVLTAWSAQALTPEIIKQTIDELDIKSKIDTKKIIIPGLLSNMKDELNDFCSEYEFIEGAKEASDISDFVKNYLANKNL